MDQEKIGKLIAKQRKMKGLTQQQLGDMVGVGYRAVSKWETGLTMPDISNINELCKILDITSDELLKGELNKKEATKTSHHTTKKLLFIIIPVIIIAGIIIGIIIKNNTKVYEYDLIAADQSKYQIEGKLTLKGNKLSVQINKLKFNDYELLKTYIKNYQYNMFSIDKTLFGFGYNSISESVLNETSIREFQKTFIIDYKDIPPISKNIIIKNNLILEFTFIDVNDNQINEKIEIILVPHKEDKSTN